MKWWTCNQAGYGAVGRRGGEGRSRVGGRRGHGKEETGQDQLKQWQEDAISRWTLREVTNDLTWNDERVNRSEKKLNRQQDKRTHTHTHTVASWDDSGEEHGPSDTVVPVKGKPWELWTGREWRKRWELEKGWHCGQSGGSDDYYGHVTRVLEVNGAWESWIGRQCDVTWRYRWEGDDG